ncbi:hypothetical protein B0H13DRAFT_1853784 [Mycena leptocephala]|nr:hypothetical protein B0H13DRAFT_1853784 [Mycena leptocephala]
MSSKRFRLVLWSIFQTNLKALWLQFPSKMGSFILLPTAHRARRKFNPNGRQLGQLRPEWTRISGANRTYSAVSWAVGANYMGPAATYIHVTKIQKPVRTLVHVAAFSLNPSFRRWERADSGDIRGEDSPIFIHGACREWMAALLEVHWHSTSRRMFTGRAVASAVGRMIAIGTLAQYESENIHWTCGGVGCWSDDCDR